MAGFVQPSELGIENLGKPLDRSAVVALPELVSSLQHALLWEAVRLSKEPYISVDDLETAYHRLAFPERDALSLSDAQAVITRALRENRAIEWVSYGMAVVLFIFGLALFVFGVANADSATRVGAFIGGSLVETLILIPFRFAINSRRQNISLRMVGIILNRVDDPKKMSQLLLDTFAAVVVGKQAKNGAE
ncbi:MAG TPA: hypothetical protein VFE46_06405 [Pirellulales bacterium]|jgi:hypothetical protein|nr:hypothetical protein [Pirellulales bacterium]